MLWCDTTNIRSLAQSANGTRAQVAAHLPEMASRVLFLLQMRRLTALFLAIVALRVPAPAFAQTPADVLGRGTRALD